MTPESTKARVRELIAAGMTNKQIARVVGCSPATVKHHAHTIFLEYGVKTRLQAALAYRDRQNEAA